MAAAAEDSEQQRQEQEEAEMLRQFVLPEPIMPPPRPGRTESEAHMILRARRDTVDMGRVGLINYGIRDIALGNTRATMRHELVRSCARFCIAQALLDGIGNVEETLALREFNPQLDFMTSSPARECPAEWRWPPWGTYDVADNWYEVYSGRRWDNSNRSAIVFYGMRNLSQELHVSRIEFWRGRVRRIQEGDISDILDPHTDYLMATPVMYKRGDTFRLVVHTTQDAIGKYDRIRPLGLVAEPLSLHETG